MKQSLLCSVDFYTWVLLPLMIFLARILDVSLGTLRIIFLSKGYKWLAPFLGFFEILIWLLAIREVMVNLRSPMCFIGYAAGFAFGNYVGIVLEDKLSIGYVLFRLVLKKESPGFLKFMKEHHFGFTIVNGTGNQGKVKILFSILKRKDMKMIIPAIKKFIPSAFYSIENVKEVKKGIFPTDNVFVYQTLFRKYRKAK
jgi:uncharacterized protein YebE (UPF0316 family)